MKKTDVPRSEVMRKVSLHFAQVLLAGSLLAGGVRLSIKYIRDGFRNFFEMSLNVSRRIRGSCNVLQLS